MVSVRLGSAVAAAIGFACALGCTLVACRPRPVMCGVASECGARGACVSGRCQGDGGTPQVDLATRYVSEPVDLACIGDDDQSPPGVPATCTLGRARASRLLLRFSVPLSDQAEVVEAYVLLHRAPESDPDPSRFTLSASRITSDWTSASLTYATLPTFVPARSADTLVDRADVIRVDVRDIVRQWRRRDPSDRGVVIESRAGSGAGLDVAVAPRGNGAARGPLLEIYVK